jgi:hypothetical protein
MKTPDEMMTELLALLDLSIGLVRQRRARTQAFLRLLEATSKAKALPEVR